MDKIAGVATRITIVLGFLLIVAAPTPAQAGEPPHLFKVLGASSAPWEGSQEVEVDAGMLATKKAKQIIVDLPDGTSWQVNRHRLQRRESGNLSWFGRIPQHPGESVILSVEGRDISGIIPGPTGVYVVRRLGQKHVVYRVDDKDWPDEGPPRIPNGLDEGQGAAGAEAPQAVTDSISHIRVMVVTSQDTRLVGNIRADAHLMLDETNEAFANSGAPTRIVYAYTFDSNYWDSGDIGTDLDNLTDGGTGLAQVASTRDTQDADIVVLIVENALYNGAAVCGLAWRLTGEGHNFWPKAYAVVERGCGLSNYSFAHEVGHVFGLDHDRDHADPANPPFYDFAYGYQHSNSTVWQEDWRTIMAYTCDNKVPATSCPRIQYFSNPRVDYNNGLTQTPTGIQRSSPNAAFNKKALGNEDDTVANFMTGTGP